MLVRGMLDNPAPPGSRNACRFRCAWSGDAEALDKAVQIRHAAYARHVPDLALTLLQPEAADFPPVRWCCWPNPTLIPPLGTMRIQTNRYEPLALEQSLALPDDSERLPAGRGHPAGVAEGRVGTLVKTVLKAFTCTCLHSGVD